MTNPNIIKWSWNPFRVWSELRKPEPTLSQLLEYKRHQLDQLLENNELSRIAYEYERQGIVAQLKFLKEGTSDA